MKSKNNLFYGRYLIVIAGLGGLLYGIDVGIISAALLFIGKTIPLTLAQTSIIVSAVLGGSMTSSLGAGFLADWLGRKAMMVSSGALFLASVFIIVSSHDFAYLFVGRLLQGISGGVIAVVIPLFLAEVLSAETRGRGSAIFQFMLTLGILLAAGIGWHYTRQASLAVAAANGNLTAILAAENHAWRGMFLSVAYPGIAFFVGCFFLSETPRWFLERNRISDALQSLCRSLPENEARRQLEVMRTMPDTDLRIPRDNDNLLQRRYILPFLLTCAVLICNQTTGINSILAYLSIILKQAGLAEQHAAQGDFAVKLLNCLFTILAIFLIDTRGRKFLLTIGTAGMSLALTATAILFHNLHTHGPSESLGWEMSICMGIFISAFAVGPGVVVWLTLSELMPIRIRSAGMGIALVLNQGAGTLIAAVFLPFVSRHGYGLMFAGLAVCTLFYFIVAAFLLPETKGKTLEEIEHHFARQTPPITAAK